MNFKYLGLWIQLIILSVTSIYAQERIRNILVIHSYSPDNKWTQELNLGITEYFSDLNQDFSLFTEYMDSKYFFNEERMKSIAALYKEKYSNINFDGIITSDNNALTLINYYGERLFYNTPIVSCGINGPVDDANMNSRVSLQMERANHYETIKQALNLFPATNKINIVVDSTITGKLICKEVENELNIHNLKIPWNIIADVSFENLKDIIQNLDSNEIVYILPYYKDRDGKYFTQGTAEKALAEISSVPIFVSWEFQINTGVMGGNLISSYEVGRDAAERVVKNINSSYRNLIEEKVLKSYNEYDYRALKKFGIKQNQLPPKTIIINEEKSVIQKYWKLLLIIIFITLFLILFIYLLLRNLINQREINNKNIQILEIENNFIKSQKELILTLGEVIERRSMETGEHVKRVSEIAGFIA
ncbi:MAG: hypothetical protein JXR64_08075 [Spirochaetales bacterium]|nr:hypothetical protein [Spirochaetales bacterium]